MRYPAMAPMEPLAVASEKPLWNLRQMGLAYCVGVVLQLFFLPCLCEIGTAKMTLALVVDGLVGVRVAAAYTIGQRDRGWMFYCVLLYTSAGWITILARLILGPHLG